MRPNIKAVRKFAFLLPLFLLLAAGFSSAQQQINLTAGPGTLTLPDGSTLPMWGYSCGTAVAGSTATCSALNRNATGGWSPVIITVPTGTAGGLQINLTNNLSFQPPTPTGGSVPAANNIPTSIVVVGQVGGGLGDITQRTTSPPPDHSGAQANVTWFVANTGAQGEPPLQGPRVRSFGTEVQATPSTTAQTPTTLTWANPRPGTYLLESGTHPSIQVPMGLYGILVVTSAPSGTTAGTAYPAVGTSPAATYKAEVPLEFSEIDPVQNREVDAAVRTAGFSENATMGTYLGGAISRIYLSSGGSGYTTAPTVTISGGGATTAATAVATIDTDSTSPTYGQVTFINVTNGGVGYTSTPNVVISGGVGGSGAAATAQLALGTDALAHCGEGLSAPAAACYPPVVNYTPFYYLINGVAFSKNGPNLSLFSATAGVTATGVPVTTGITGNVLVRMVNAGLRMHVPAIVGSQTQGFSGAGASASVTGFALIAEDGNPIPGGIAAPRVQTDVFMAASKTFDVLINVPPVCTTVPVAATCTGIPVFDRELSLSGNASERDAGMLAYIGINGAPLPSGAQAGLAAGFAQAINDNYPSLVAGQTFTVSDVSKGVIANDINVYGVQLLTPAANGTVTLNANGTFTYVPNAGSTATSDSFTYCANSAVTGTTCPSGLVATVTMAPSALKGNPVAADISYTAKTGTLLKIPPPGILAVDSDPNSLPLTVLTSPMPALSGGTLTLDATGGFVASVPKPGTYQFTYQAKNSQGSLSNTATVTLNFPQPSNLQVRVVDAKAYNSCAGNSTCIQGLTNITDYRWVIEEDKTFYVDPACTTNSSISVAGCPGPVAPADGTTTVPTAGVNFHTSHQEYVMQGCTGPLSCEGGQTVLDNNPSSATYGQHVPAVCDLGNGACRPDPNAGTANQGLARVTPDQVVLDPSKRYYISVLPGDAANPFNTGNVGNGCSPTATTSCPSVGHTMSGAPIPAACNVLGGPNGCSSSSTFASVLVPTLATPLPTGKLSVMVFEDDFPLNGEQDAGGSSGVVAANEPGLGGFNLVLWDTYGGLGDVTGQDTYDEFNQPLSNALSGTIDPATGLNACPISAQAITGMIVTCPKYESDGSTLSPLAGQALIANLMPEKFSVQAYPGADRIARGEEWIQTNTLDGQHPHDSFIRIGEPSYFQEYGPAGYHVSIGFANPAIINARHDSVCAGAYGATGPCNNSIEGQVNVQRLSRTPDQRLYPSGSHDALAWTQCWVSLGDPDAEDFMFTKCDANGNFKFTNVPGGNWRLTIGDQWNDQIIDGLSTPANVGCIPATQGAACPAGTITNLNLGMVGVQQWQANIYTRTFVDDNKNGIWDSNEIGIPFINTTVRYRDGHMSNNLVTDFNGVANFNETFPLFNWYAVEADTTRYKTTGIHTVYDAGGPADGSPSCGTTTNGARPCGTSTAYNFLANTFEAVPLPADLSVPGAVYCAKADCTTEATSFAAGTAIPSSSTASTGRIDPPWVLAEGWSGETSQGNWIDFGKAPYAPCPPACATVPVPATNAPGAPTTTQVGENGGIHGHVVYSSTRPFDDASLLVQEPWEPLVPHVTINLYQEGFASDGVTPTLKLVDTTQTSSWDDWAQGFYPNYTDPVTGTPKPYMSCPGQGSATGTNADLFFFSLKNQPYWLDLYNSLHTTGASLHSLPYNAEYKCYDAMHIWNQVQPAPYDGVYSFPSSLGINPTNGKQLSTVGATNGVAASMPGTNCTVCVANPDSSDAYRYNSPMLPPGKYVVEVVPPPGYEIEKEEDKNLLIGDNFIAPVTQEFSGLGGNIFIMPDQASVAALYDTSGSGYNPNNAQNATTATGMAANSQFVPGFLEPVWPCAGEMRTVPDYLSLFPQALEVAPFAGAVRPLCDRKEVTLDNQMGAIAKFYVFTSTHIAANYTGVITDDFTSEFDPFAPQFGEKFSPPNMPVSTRDYLGNEISRVYADHFGIYNGLAYSSWEVNPPNITGYSPTMFIQCMNDPGPIPGPNGTLVNDPLYQPAYANFCYEEPYMPGLTTYLDTPVVPTQAFVGAGYNNPDCNYPDATPAIAEVDGDGVGPWVRAAGHALTITALGNQIVTNYGYAGPSAHVDPFDLKTITRHYGFGSRCTAVSGSCTAVSTVTIGGVVAPITNWSDTSITVAAPSGVPACAIQQQAQYGGSPASCGQLLITAGNGRQSIDSVTVTIGGKMPSHVAANQTIQSAIDAAAPGDLIIVDPTCTATASGQVPCTTAGVAKTLASHTEMLIMWKPVRLQGVGAATTIVNANAIPAGTLLDPWRRHINCLFGLTLQGVPYTSTGSGAGYMPGALPYDPNYNGTAGSGYTCPDTGWNYFTAQPNAPQIDRLPLEAIVGWDATLNGNLAELLQEPSLMGAYEGAGITVLGKGVWVPPGENPWSDGSEGGAFPGDALLLQDVPVGPDDEGAALGPQYSYCWTTTPTRSTKTELVPNPYPSNFMCNPSSIDGLSITNSSQGGGGIFVHGWAHNLQIANNRVYNNAGTLSGGISVGQGEFPIAITVVDQEGTSGPTAPLGEFVPDNPPSCLYVPVLGTHLPYCLDVKVNVHNNFITDNSSIGDELFSGTLSGGGGATVCTGSDYYKFNSNWVCGNLSSGEGGGLVHLGFIYDGDIEHNSFLFNQSTNPTIPTNGGGIMVQGTPDTDPTCPGVADTDCPPGLSDGTGPNLVINANLIQGNSADSGAGGGIRLQQVNGTEVATFAKQPQYWNSVTITNNIITNNVAGWDGAGISLQDALNVTIRNNTITNNDSLATSGVLTQSIGTPQASAPAGNCVQAGPSGTTQASCPQSAGVTSTLNSALLTSSYNNPPVKLTCPTGHPNCQVFSSPILANNVIWQNRSFFIGVGSFGSGNQNQQKIITLFDAFTNNPAPSQATTGGCTDTESYWEIGVRGDKGPANHSSGVRLSPTYSVLTDANDYPGQNNLGTNPALTSQYCNGSRVPPECTTQDGCGGPHGFGVPPGIVDAQAPNPVFSLTPSATVDEGNNWINVSWGPLSMRNPVSNAQLGNWTMLAGSQAIDYIPVSVTHPATDFFGNPRPDAANRNRFDVGAIEAQKIGGTAGPTVTSITPNTGARGTTVPVVILGTNFDSASAVTMSGAGVTCTVTQWTATQIDANCVITATATLSTRNVQVSNAIGSFTLPAAFTVTGPTLTSIVPNTGFRGTAVNVTLTGTGLTGATGLTFTGAGLTDTAFTAVNATTVTATIHIATTATLGAHTVAVATPIGNTNTVTFTVNGPALTAITPASGGRGATVPVTITGTDLTGATAVNAGTGVTASGIVVNAAGTSLTAKLAIALSASPTVNDVLVQTPAGTTPANAAVTFTVIGATVAFSGPVPSLHTGGTTRKTGLVTVTNAAAATGPFTFTAAPTVVKAGNNGGTFSIIAGGTCTATTVLTPGNRCTINVQYAPGGSNATTTAYVSITGTGLSTASQASATFMAN